MKTKILLLALFFCCSLQGLTAQVSARLYANALVLKGSPVPAPFGYEAQWIDYHRLTYGIRWHKEERKFRQVDLRLHWSTDDVVHKVSEYVFDTTGPVIITPIDTLVTLQPYRVKSTGVQLNYLLGKYFKQPSDTTDWRFHFGVQLGCFAYWEDMAPLSSLDFPRDRSVYGVKAGLLLGIEYALSDRIQLEANLSALNLSFALDYQTKYDPSLPERQQRNGGFDFGAYGERFLRIGLAIQI